MRILIVTGSYYPNYSAVGVCAKNIADALIKRGHEVDVLANKTRIEDIPILLDGSSVYYYSTIEIDKRLTKSGLSLFLYRIQLYIKFVLSKVSIKRDVVTVISSHIASLLQKGNVYDYILPMVFPIEGLLGSLHVLNDLHVNQIKVVPVIFDNFVENPSLHRFKLNRNCKRQRHLSILESALSQCHHIIVMQHQQAYFNNLNMPSLSRTYFLEHPLLVPPVFNDIPSDAIELLYAGSFIKGYVESKGLCNMLRRIVSVRPDIKVQFCVMGNDTRRVSQLEKKYPKSICNNGYQSANNVKNFMAECGVFLCVAEKNGVQMSSKIFTYMSYGKPIILIYYNDNDVNLRILKKYPLLCAIKNTEIQQKIDEVIRFIDNNRGSMLNYLEVLDIYSEASPDVLCDYIFHD